MPLFPPVIRILLPSTIFPLLTFLSAEISMLPSYPVKISANVKIQQQQDHAGGDYEQRISDTHQFNTESDWIPSQIKLSYSYSL